MSVCQSIYIYIVYIVYICTYVYIYIRIYVYVCKYIYIWAIMGLLIRI